MFVGMMEYDVILGDIHSLKSKRAVVRPLVARLRRLGVSAAEVGDAEKHRRARIGAATVSGDASVIRQMQEECERIVANNLQTQLLSSRSRIISMDDEPTPRVE